LPGSYWYPLDADLVLASRSPRRARILEMAGIPFRQLPSSVEEAPLDADPEEVVGHWARAKAEDVAGDLPDSPVLGGDTMVAVEDRILGKPADRREAEAMLRRLSGSWHTVYGGACILWPARGLDVSVVERTRVCFRPLSAGEIAAYVDTGEPMDKAGAYGIQGYGCVLVERIDGCYFNVMGLPISRLLARLRAAAM
jgi:septum formation protein